MICTVVIFANTNYHYYFSFVLTIRVLGLELLRECAPFPDHLVVMLTMSQPHARVPRVGSPGTDIARCCVTQMSAWYSEKWPDISTLCTRQLSRQWIHKTFHIFINCSFVKRMRTFTAYLFEQRVAMTLLITNGNDVTPLVQWTNEHLLAVPGELLVGDLEPVLGDRSWENVKKSSND